MGRGMKMAVGLGSVVVLIGAWLVVASVTGAEMGEPCNGDGDGDCKGLEAACVTNADHEKYCTTGCTSDGECPSGWSCGSVDVTNIDGHGNMTSGGSDQLCVRAVPAPAP